MCLCLVLGILTLQHTEFQAFPVPPFKAMISLRPAYSSKRQKSVGVGQPSPSEDSALRTRTREPSTGRGAHRRAIPSARRGRQRAKGPSDAGAARRVKCERLQQGFRHRLDTFIMLRDRRAAQSQHALSTKINKPVTRSTDQQTHLLPSTPQLNRFSMLSRLPPCHCSGIASSTYRAFSNILKQKE